MTGIFSLDWAVLAVSLLNTVLLLWLGLTVLLNAERRSWGMWLSGGGLLLGGAFFVSHSAILEHDLRYASRGLEFWWRVGWVPVVALPLAWYAVILWYAGFWADGGVPLRRRHRVWFALCMGLAVGIVSLFLFANPLPSYGQLTQPQWSATPSVAGVPLLFLLYPAYVVLCIVLALDTLRRPGLSARPMATQARQRAHPWLVAASIVLFLVSLLVAGSMAWLLSHVQRGTIVSTVVETAVPLAWLDLIVSALVATSVLLLGQAVVSYEIFTGKILPRRGFLRHWRNAVFLAVGYSAVMSWSLAIQLRPVYGLLLSALLMVVFFALLSQHSFAERERTMAQLRPFATSQQLYDSVVSSPRSTADTVALFRALCEEVLGAELAYLLPQGSLAAMIESPLAYPDHRNVQWESVLGSMPRLGSADHLWVPVDPGRCGGAEWAVPLWGTRGRLGVLLLGPKRDGGLYSEEEIEIARASGERLLDTLAAVETARRLRTLLRQRIAQVRVMEGQGRRVLHDRVLPQLHAAVVHLSSLPSSPPLMEAVEALASVHHQIAELMRAVSSATPEQLTERGLAAALRTLIDSDFQGAFDDVTWRIDPVAEASARQLPVWVGEVVYYAACELIRNAARHGRGGNVSRSLRLQVALEEGEGLCLCVQDDGVGLDSGLRSASCVAETGGQGLDFHRTMLTALGARLEITAPAEGGTCGVIVLPTSAIQAAAAQHAHRVPPGSLLA